MDVGFFSRPTLHIPDKYNYKFVSALPELSAEFALTSHSFQYFAKCARAFRRKGSPELGVCQDLMGSAGVSPGRRFIFGSQADLIRSARFYSAALTRRAAISWSRCYLADYLAKSRLPCAFTFRSHHPIFLRGSLLLLSSALAAVGFVNTMSPDYRDNFGA